MNQSIPLWKIINSHTHTHTNTARKKGTKELQNNQKMANKLAIVSLYLSIIIQYINELNSPTKGIKWLNENKKQRSK